MGRINILNALHCVIMYPRGRDDDAHSVSRATVSRRKLLAVSGVAAVGGLGGCLSRVASAVTNTGASPAAAFAGERTEQFTLSDPRVSRLTPTLSAGSRGVSGGIDLEGWVTSSSVVATNYNNTRSNRSTIASPDSAVTDEERERIHRYLAGEAVVAERFTVCLPDAEVPGGNGSIVETVTPKRFIDYVTGQTDTGGRVYSWGDADSDGDGIGDCDDREESGSPGAVCGRTEHLLAAISGPTATGGRLEVVRASDGTLLVVNSPPEVESGRPIALIAAEGGADGPESSTEAIYQARIEDAGWSGSSDGGGKSSPFIFETLVSQVLVQPPGCPHAFPALLFVGRGVSDGQLVYSGGWVIDDAALYEESMTVLSMADAARIIGIDFGDLDADGDGLDDAVERAVAGEPESVC